VPSRVLRVFPSADLSSVNRAYGLTIETDQGNYLDTTAGGTSYAIFGWNHPKVHQAMMEQMSKYSHLDYKIWDDPNLELLADVILKSNPGNLKQIYFSGNSGAEACEAAMKISFQAHLQNGKKDKIWFISRKQSYHGATADALSVGERPNLEIFRRTLSPFRSQISMHHFRANAKDGESKEEYADRCAQELESEILKIGPEKVSGFIGETIMGGLVGDVPPVGEYWKKVKRVCEKYDVHLILDEVYCGTGTTGRYFSFEHDDVSPDLVFFGKTLAAGYGALSAVAINPTIIDALVQNESSRIQHSTTHQGHSLSVAAALAIQGEINQEKFLQEVTEKGLYFREHLNQSLSDYDFLFDTRGRGLRFSIEHNIHFDNQIEFGNEIEQECKARGLLINAKWHRICFTPALIISYSQIDFAVEVLKTSLDRVMSKKLWKRR